MDERLQNRFERKKQRTRAQLKQAAVELLFEAGYASMSVSEIARRADVGHGTFYLHYADKDDILWDLIIESVEAQIAEMNASMDVMKPKSREYDSWVFLFRQLAERSAYFLMFFGRDGSPTLRQRYQDFLAMVYTREQEAWRYSLRMELPLQFTAQFMAGATLQLMLWWLETPNDYGAEEMATMLYRMVYRETPP
jgi:AcrR family transcriptional regulator